MKALQVLLAALILAAGTYPAMAGQEPASGSLMFSAQMTGDQEVPAVPSWAKGMLVIYGNAGGSVLRYTLRVSDVSDLGQVAIYLAPAGQRGAMLVQLLPSTEAVPCEPRLDSTWCQSGVIRESACIGSLAKLVQAMQEGNAYAEVSSFRWPQGEIRGQIEPLAPGLVVPSTPDLSAPGYRVAPPPQPDMIAVTDKR